MSTTSRLRDHRAIAPLRRFGERALDELFQRAKRLPILRDRIADEEKHASYLYGMIAMAVGGVR